jgi:DNA-binding beta-propeller fold protein YncE
VKAVLGPQKTSGPSNEVKAGPPPTGFNVVTLTPKDRELDFGYAMTMVLDSNEDPVFAYTFRDPNNKNKRADNQLFFGGWDRAKYRWREPVQVDVIGDFWSDTVRPIALALDASTGQFGLAYVRSSGAREIAFSSDRGNTWIKQTLPATNGQDAHGCTLAMGGGNIYMATFSNSGPTYISGKASEPAAKWTQT